MNRNSKDMTVQNNVWDLMEGESNRPTEFSKHWKNQTMSPEI